MMIGLSLGLCSTTGQGGGWSPSSLGASLLAWWTADRSDLITLSGSSVTNWRDAKNGYDLAQPVSSARPSYSVTSFNGAPSLTFDSADDELSMASQPFPSGAARSEVWAVAQQDAAAADATNRRIFAYGDAANTSRQVVRVNTGGVNRASIWGGTGAAVTTAIVNNVDLSSRHVVRAIFDATAISGAVDGQSPISAASVNATAAIRTRVGAAPFSAPSGFWNGKIRDVIVTAPLTTDQAAALLAWALPRRML